MAYADYEFYKHEYLGCAISDSDFARLAMRASEYIDAFANPQQASPEQLRRACCSVAEVIQTIERGGEISSESSGKWSRTFVRKEQSDEEKILNAMKLHLGRSVGTVIQWA